MVKVNEAFIHLGGCLHLTSNHHGGLILPTSYDQNVGTLRGPDVAVVLEVLGGDARSVRVLGPNGSGWIGTALLKLIARESE
jgi:hypothetical protein